jgi:hypothetical protein
MRKSVRLEAFTLTLSSIQQSHTSLTIQQSHMSHNSSGGSRSCVWGGGQSGRGHIHGAKNFPTLFEDHQLGDLFLYSLSQIISRRNFSRAKWAGQGGGFLIYACISLFSDFHDFQGGNCPCPCLRAPMAKSSSEGPKIEAPRGGVIYVHESSPANAYPSIMHLHSMHSLLSLHISLFILHTLS